MQTAKKRHGSMAEKLARAGVSARYLSHSLQHEREFMENYGHLTNNELSRAAHDMEMLGFRLRHLLWQRLEKSHQHN